MTNREFYKEQILDIVCGGKWVAVDKKTNKPCDCEHTDCDKCIFDHSMSEKWDCKRHFAEWCNAEYVEPCPFEKDELVEVSDNGKQWALRYFSHQEASYVYCYEFGFTSKETSEISNWKYCQKYGTLGGLVKENRNETKS